METDQAPDARVSIFRRPCRLLAALDGESLTAAIVVVHKGRIIGERYGRGADRDTVLELVDGQESQRKSGSERVCGGQASCASISRRLGLRHWIGQRVS